MMSKLVDLVGKLLGMNKLLMKIDGYKTYIGGITQMLAGAAAMLTGCASLLAQLTSLQGLSTLIEFMKNASQDPAVLAIMAGAAVFGKGLADVGKRHALAKKDATVPEPPAPPAA